MDKTISAKWLAIITIAIYALQYILGSNTIIGDIVRVAGLLFLLLTIIATVREYASRRVTKEVLAPKKSPSSSQPVARKFISVINLQKIFLALFTISVLFGSLYAFDKYKDKVMAYNTERLIELGVSRERIYWRCLGEHNQKIVEDYKASEAHKVAIAEHDKCVERTKSLLPCSTWSCMNATVCGWPEAWREWPNSYNEQNSPECSKIADESDDGRLMREFRKKVPIEILTDNELRYKIMNIVRSF